MEARKLMQEYNQKVANGVPVPPGEWVDVGQMMISLKGTEDDRYWEMRSQVANLREDYWNSLEKKSDTRAEAWVETTPEWLEMKKLEALIVRIEEFIKMCKYQARLTEADLKGQSL